MLIVMDSYEKLRDLLLDESSDLTSEQAKEVIARLIFNPSWYESLLQEQGAFMYLKRYVGSSDDGVHEFAETNLKVFSEKIAHKFIKLQHDFVFKVFIDMISYYVNSCCDENDPSFFEWPYMDVKEAKGLTYGAIKEIIESGFFVFNFENDEKGEYFGGFCDLVCFDENMVKLLAINSFNISSFLDNGEFVDRMNIVDAVELNAYASHYFDKTGSNYCIYRKMFIRYLLYVHNVTDATNNFLSSYQQKQNGVIPS